MKILISGVCGFVGSVIARGLLECERSVEIIGLDNLIRPGSGLNALPLRTLGVKVRHADVRLASDLESLPAVDWIIDAAANPSVLAGVFGNTTSRQVIEHNLGGSINLLEIAKRHQACFSLLSTSRVYSIARLAELPVQVKDHAFQIDESALLPHGISALGIDETFSTLPPISLYGATKLASEILALEYGNAFDFPVWINRCGVMAGAGQFGRPDQGIFAYWINAYLRGEPLKYIGLGGTGRQTRDCFHPRDLLPLLLRQFRSGECNKPRVINLGGGLANTMSLAQLTRWCAARFGQRRIAVEPAPRPFDVPWVVIDSHLAEQIWNWRPAEDLESILTEIAAHAEAHPEWLRISASHE
ncbi:NAD-dependent epimerase/dehydratase family protein [soil metagenome]